MAGVTERNTSLQSGSIDSVQNREAELHDFEARWRRAEIFAFGKFRISPRLCLVLRKLLKKFDQNFNLLIKLKIYALAKIHLTFSLFPFPYYLKNGNPRKDCRFLL